MTQESQRETGLAQNAEFNEIALAFSVETIYKIGRQIHEFSVDICDNVVCLHTLPHNNRLRQYFGGR